MKHLQDNTIYATQGGGYARIINNKSYFVVVVDIPEAYRYEVGDEVPEQWDLAQTQFKSVDEIQR